MRILISLIVCLLFSACAQSNTDTKNNTVPDSSTNQTGSKLPPELNDRPTSPPDTSLHPQTPPPGIEN